MEGTPFGRYRLVELLGRGGMGEVWRAFDEQTSRVVAVKLLPKSMGADPVFEQRFRREALAAASLNEPHVVPIHQFGEIDGRLYVDMRLIEGRDLQAMLRAGPLDTDRAVAIIEQVASALHAAHRIGLIHRDVKPSNILVTEDDFAYLIDFGIARAANESGLTTPGSMIGTPEFVAPERFMDGTVDARCDVYALACVLFEAVTGKRAFSGNAEQVLMAHLAETRPRPSSLRPELPAEFDAVVATGLAKDPEKRYAGTKEFAKAARGALTQAPRTTPVRPAQPAPPTSAPPGWYQDPDGARGARYWDGARWTNHRRFTPERRRGADQVLHATLTLEECAAGAVKHVTVDTAVACHRCDGGGMDTSSPSTNCPTCGGRGVNPYVAAPSGVVPSVPATCLSCDGKGKVMMNPCSRCGGEGRERTRRSVQYRVPAGVGTGMRIRLAGQGEVGPGGGPAGDLYVEVHEHPHVLFRRDGDDLHCTVSVPVKRAKMGAPVTLIGVFGEHIEVPVPKGTRSDFTTTLAGHGMSRLRSPARGNLYVRVALTEFR